MTDEQKTNIGKELIKVLCIRKMRNLMVGLYITSEGLKTPRGIYETVKKIMEVK